MAKTEIAVADLQPITAEGVRAILEATSEFELAYAVTCLDRMRESLQDATRRILLVHSWFGGKAILALLADLDAARSAAAVVIWGTRITAGQAAQYLRVGARGVLSGSAAPADLLACFRAVSSGTRYLDPELGRIRSLESPLNGCALTRREQQVVDCIRRGDPTNADIGVELGITLGTVKVHLKRIMQKTGVRGRHALAAAALADDTKAAVAS